MISSRLKTLRLLRLFIGLLVIVLIAAYALWRSLPYLNGPSVVIFQPFSGSSLASSTVVIIGRAERVNSLSIDGVPLSIDQDGAFKATRIVFPGSNTITIRATDQFGRQTEDILKIFGTVPLPATTTAPH